MRRALLLAALALLLTGCGAGGAPPAKPRRAGGIPPQLLAGLRPIGRGPRFRPPLGGPVIGACTATRGRRFQVHVELFGADRVVLLPAGIGTRAPRRLSDGRLTHARCFGDLVTLDPTGTVYLRPGTPLTLGDLFRSWGQPLRAGRMSSFRGRRVRVYVNGVAHHGAPAAVRLHRGAEVVLEVGPHVPPHAHFAFAVAPSARLR